MRRVSPLLFALVLVSLIAIGLRAQRSWRAGPGGHHVQGAAASRPGGEVPSAPASEPASEPAPRLGSTAGAGSSQPQRPGAGTVPAPRAATARADRAGTPGVLERSTADVRGAPGGVTPVPPPAPSQPPQRTAPAFGAVATGGVPSASPSATDDAAAGGPSPRGADSAPAAPSGSGGGEMNDADLADALARCDLGEDASPQALRERRDLGLTLLSILPPDERREMEQRLSGPGAEERCRGES